MNSFIHRFRLTLSLAQVRVIRPQLQAWNHLLPLKIDFESKAQLEEFAKLLRGVPLDTAARCISYRSIMRKIDEIRHEFDLQEYAIREGEAMTRRAS